MSKILAFLAAVPGSVRGQVNGAELYRAVMASGVASVLVTAALSALGAVSADAPHIFASPRVAAFAVWALGLVADLLRRLGHEAPTAPGT